MGRGRDIKNIDSYLDEAIQNIRDDRSTIGTLLTDLIIDMKKSVEKNKDASLAAAKYVETLQRSNEQLVKIAAIMQKREVKKEGFTDLDKKELFEIIKSEGDDL